ncbi:hypothetical protein [Paraflavitalea pollutisoli]|uniref:hypothetical protein n=1 Tax=Paraflavitalea pollutisoli TaxID=3034143 RepID=UPI0023EB8BAB|nr:hypothetical protein [Paraflavitalea sp. H1-2-19X]
MSEKIKTTIFGNQYTVVKKMRDYSKDPYFIKKLEEAKQLIERVGLPKSFQKNK